MVEGAALVFRDAGTEAEAETEAVVEYRLPTDAVCPWLDAGPVGMLLNPLIDVGGRESRMVLAVLYPLDVECLSLEESDVRRAVG